MHRLDERDLALFGIYMAEFEKMPGPRVGDFIDFADGPRRRVAVIWRADGVSVQIQTGSLDGHRYHLICGHIAHGGSSYLPVPLSSLTPTGERRKGGVWIWHHGLAGRDRAVYADVLLRVYRSSENAPQC